MATSTGIQWNDRQTCPGMRTLRAFAHGMMSSADIEAVGMHVADCVSCGQRLEEFDEDGDSFLDYLRLADEELADETEFRHLKRRLRDLPSSAIASHTRSSEISADRKPGDESSNRRVPRRLGHYELREKIGQGAMGSVYGGWHARLKRRVVIKLLSPARLNDAQAIARFHREMEVIGRLDDHPNIVRARDAGEVDGFHYLVMDYVEGIDVRELLNRVGQLRVSDAAEVVRQAACGLDHAHRCGIIHRDVKPSNLLLTRVGEVKLLDLGLAAYEKGSRRGKHSSDLVVGTADYMAPEQWDDSGQVEFRADIYAVGCTLFELLVGRAPFSNGRRTSRAKMLAHRKFPVPSVRSLRPEVSKELDAVVKRMLSKAPVERYSCGADVSTAMQPFAEGCDLVGLIGRIRRPKEDTKAKWSDITYISRQIRAHGRKAVLSRAFFIVAAIAGLALMLATLTVVGIGAKWPAPELTISVGPADAVLWRYDPTQETLQVQSKDAVFFRWGDSTGNNYDIQTSLVQRDWRAQAGIYWGCRSIAKEDETHYLMQTVCLRTYRDEAMEESYEIAHTELSLVKQTSERVTRSQNTLASVPVDVSSIDRAHVLRVVITDGKLDHVEWDDTRLTELRQTVVAQNEPGIFGVFNLGGAITFHKTKFTVD